MVKFDINSNDNTAITVRPNAKITEAHTNYYSSKHVEVTIKLFNSGLTCNKFAVKIRGQSCFHIFMLLYLVYILLSKDYISLQGYIFLHTHIIVDCPLKVPAKWNIMSVYRAIPPQSVETFTTKIMGPFPQYTKDFYCTVTALDLQNAVLAFRKVRFVKKDTCLCSWYCKCGCVKTTGLKCNPLDKNHYEAGGFSCGRTQEEAIVKVRSCL